MSVAALLPALPLQTVIGNLRQVTGGSPLYISQRCFRVTPALDPEVLAASWRAIHARHEALRSRLIHAEGRWIQAIFAQPYAELYESLDATMMPESHRARVRRDLVQRHAARLVGEHAPPAILGGITSDQATDVVLSWRHEFLDGTGVAVVLDDLKAWCEGLERGEPTRLVTVIRDILAMKRIELGIDVLGPPPEDLATFPSALAPVTSSSGIPQSVTSSARRNLDAEQVRASARASGSTPAVLLTAAWIAAIVDATGSAGFVVVAQDCRPLAHRQVAGMFTGVAAAWRPPAVSSVAELAARLQAHRSMVAGRQPVSLSNLLRPAWEAGAIGMPDVLLTVHRAPGNLTPLHNWEPVDAVERTDFALNVDVLLGDDTHVVAHRDAARLTDTGLNDILDNFVHRIEHSLTGFGKRARVTVPRELHRDQARISVVLATCRRVLGEGRVRADTDLFALGVDSLTMMRLAAALGEAGLSATVSSLFRARTPTDIADAAVAMAGVQGSASTSAIERSLLQRTERHHLGRNPMHEQSILLIDERLDVGILHKAIRHVAAELEVITDRWSVESSWSLCNGHAVPFDHQDVVDDAHVESAARMLLASDLDRGFVPGDQLMRCWLVRGSRTSAFVASWHNAILDGWSHGTLIRLVQDTYRAIERGMALPPRPGAPIAAFRAFAESGAEHSEWWAGYLRGVDTPTRKLCRDHPERRLSAHHRLCATAELAAKKPRGVTVAVAALTVVAHGLVPMTGEFLNRPVGMRIGLRPPELPGSLRMVGQATLEAPLRISPAEGLADAVALNHALNAARDHGRIGECGIRAATSWPEDADLYDVLVVPETELHDDEWAARGGSSDSWPELLEWRREVSPSTITAYVHIDSATIDIRVSSTHGEPDAIAAEVAKTVETRIHDSGLTEAR
jgi:aryl carrier-like protein